MGAISHVAECADQFVSNIFLVPKPDGKFRLILNLKYLNLFVLYKHFKLEDIKVVKTLICRSSFLAKIDLKDAYFLLSVDFDHRKYLRFLFNGMLYQFNCLPFGLSCAPYIFTKILKPVVSHLRASGFCSVVYLDDFLLFGDSKRDCSLNVAYTVNLLESLGFIINREKSVFTPKHQCDFLGFTLNTNEMIISPPTNKRVKLLQLLIRFSRLKSCKIRDFAALLGKLVSINPAIKYGWVYTRSFERIKYLALLRHKNDYNATMSIPRTLGEDFDWWLKNISTSFNSLNKLDFSLENFSDASRSGWGAYCKGMKTGGYWSLSEQADHINILELKAALFGLKCFANGLKNVNILCRIDNTTAIACINKMGSVQYPQLTRLARTIWKWCESRNIFIFASYIKSRDNLEADRESRRNLSFETEWELSDKAYRKITSTFGFPVIDLFASRLNKKCKIFVSWFRDPEAFEVDAFTLIWTNLFFYAFPPFAIILRTLCKIKTDQARGILIVPLWPAQPWFPMFRSLLVGQPIVFKPDINLLSLNRQPHPMWKNLTLVAGILSGQH
uniref:Reverse transcriptase domain-containing protein n=1 Tax=Photinus pyralis TaxID=7054 RepID=A0A1Y1LH23_PHOPY